MAESKSQGLCFNCDEKFTPAHECRQLLHIEFVNEVARSDDGDPGEESNPEILLHALTGINIGRTMQLEVMVGGALLIALVDSGSTHNFVAEEVRDHLGWPIHAGCHGLKVVWPMVSTRQAEAYAATKKSAYTARCSMWIATRFR